MFCIRSGLLAAVRRLAFRIDQRTLGRRRVAAQSSLFDLANQRVVDELRAVNVEGLSPEEATQLLKDLQKRSI